MFECGDEQTGDGVGIGHDNHSLSGSLTRTCQPTSGYDTYVSMSGVPEETWIPWARAASRPGQALGLPPPPAQGAAVTVGQGGISGYQTAA
ncbi:hypothetical protein GCM10023319_12700 [Nocardia iowensis]